MKIENILQDAVKTFSEKRKQYGSTDQLASAMLKLAYPDGISPEKYNDALVFIKITEKLIRISSSDIKQESKSDAYGDIVGYGLLGLYKDGGTDKVENAEPYTPTPDDVRQAREEQATAKKADLVQKIIDHKGVKKEVAPAPPKENAEKKEEAAPVKKPNCAICGLEVEGTIPEEELKSGKTIVHNDCYSKYMREQKLKAKT